MALPLTTIDERIASVRRLALVGLAAGLVAALVLTWATSLLLNRRIRAVAETPRALPRRRLQPARARSRRATKSASSPTCSIRPRASSAPRLTEMARERAHTDAILTGMAEGVLLVTPTATSC